MSFLTHTDITTHMPPRARQHFKTASHILKAKPCRDVQSHVQSSQPGDNNIWHTGDHRHGALITPYLHSCFVCLPPCRSSYCYHICSCHVLSMLLQWSFNGVFCNSKHNDNAIKCVKYAHSQIPVINLFISLPRTFCHYHI